MVLAHLSAWFDDYNTRAPHLALGMRSPGEYRAEVSRTASRPRAAASLVFPEPLKAIRGHLGVPNRVLDVPVTEVVLNRPGIMALVRELEAAGVP
jgi:hypothetical protein